MLIGCISFPTFSYEFSIILLFWTYLRKQEIKLESVLTVSSYVLMVNVFVFHLETLTVGIKGRLNELILISTSNAMLKSLQKD